MLMDTMILHWPLPYFQAGGARIYDMEKLNIKMPEETVPRGKERGGLLQKIYFQLPKM